MHSCEGDAWPSLGAQHNAAHSWLAMASHNVILAGVASPKLGWHVSSVLQHLLALSSPVGRSRIGIEDR